MDRFEFDSVLFPVNYVCYSAGGFGPQVLKRAKEKGVARLALKALAYSKGKEEMYPKCWYRPVDERVLARLALRFTLSEDVTSAIPPGDERIYRMALDLARDLNPLTATEREVLLASAREVQPIFKVEGGTG